MQDDYIYTIKKLDPPTKIGGDATASGSISVEPPAIFPFGSDSQIAPPPAVVVNSGGGGGTIPPPDPGLQAQINAINTRLNSASGSGTCSGGNIDITINI